MKLYEMTEQYASALEDLKDFDPQTIEDSLAVLSDDINDKARNVVAYTLNQDSDIEQLKAFEKKIADKRKALENSRDSLRDYLKFNMIRLQITSIEALDKSFTAKIQKSPGRKLVIDGEVPKKYTYTETKTDTAAIKKALQNGEDIGFAHLEMSPDILKIR
jgi:hypothetical protein